jgi:putative SOS response-associated peptidase YedK
MSSVVVRSTSTAPEAVRLSWGFRNDPTAPISPINARSETAASKPFFREAWQARRCIAVADGWFEWRLEGGCKQPYYLRRRDAEPLCLAGLWTGSTFCLLTTAADGHLCEIHHRRPVAIPEDRVRGWLADKPPSSEELADLLVPASEVTFHPVSAKVSSPRNDGPELILEARLVRPEPEPDLFSNPL